ncbi:WHG domain-containing protein [bacterium]|nr:WHG domain-containing protein [bacterium]
MPRRTDTKERMLVIAVKMVNEEGWDSLNLHRLAKKLGIKTPSLYNHCKSLEQLRHQLIYKAHDELLEALRIAADGKAGKEAIISWAHAYRKYGKNNPGLLPAIAISTDNLPPLNWDDLPEKSANELFLNEAMRILKPFKLDENEMVHILRMLRSMVHGFVVLEQSAGFGLPQDSNESFTWMMDRFFEGIAQ